METLTAAQRRTHRANAHALHPFVSIGHHGLTPAVLHEIDVALLAHQLIKIRVFSDSRDERNALLERICTELSAAPVQHLGKVLIVWRKAPDIEPAEEPTHSKAPRALKRPARTLADPAAKPASRTHPPSGHAAKTGPSHRGAPTTGSAAAAARRRRPSDVVATGAVSGKRRAVTSGMAPGAHKRALATTKGPFEPGKRSPRSKGKPSARRRRGGL